MTEENFKLPSEIIPESLLKSLTEEERKNIDTSGADQKYFTVSVIGENNRQSHLDEKFRWFENSTGENAFNNRRIDSVDFSAVNCETDRIDQKSCSSVHGYVSSFGTAIITNLYHSVTNAHTCNNR